MKLKPIPQNTVVHTPTEEEAKELLAILHENGYKWCTGEDLSVVSHIAGKEAIGINLYNEEKGTIIGFLYVETAQREYFPILTLAEFKERYCEEEKPQPKFKVGDRVVTTAGNHLYGHGWEGVITEIDDDKAVIEIGLNNTFEVDLYDLEPYTEPEAKPTEDMETKENRNLSQDVAKCDKMEDKELNFVELLKGHEGEAFYSPQYGWVELVAGNPALYPNTIATTIPGTSGLAYYLPNGKYLKSDSSACVGLFPSRALYEQYPLDPYAAWMKWQEEQKTYEIKITIDYCENFMGVVDDINLIFRTPADRDKCLSEIKAIIEKYSKK
jgi:preprotein translocase subunit YajC